MDQLVQCQRHRQDKAGRPTALAPKTTSAGANARMVHSNEYVIESISERENPRMSTARLLRCEHRILLACCIFSIATILLADNSNARNYSHNSGDDDDGELRSQPFYQFENTNDACSICIILKERAIANVEPRCNSLC